MVCDAPRVWGSFPADGAGRVSRDVGVLAAGGDVMLVSSSADVERIKMSTVPGITRRALPTSESWHKED